MTSRRGFIGQALAAVVGLFSLGGAGKALRPRGRAEMLASHNWIPYGLTRFNERSWSYNLSESILDNGALCHRGRFTVHAFRPPSDLDWQLVKRDLFQQHIVQHPCNGAVCQLLPVLADFDPANGHILWQANLLEI